MEGKLVAVEEVGLLPRPRWALVVENWVGIEGEEAGQFLQQHCSYWVVEEEEKEEVPWGFGVGRVGICQRGQSQNQKMKWDLVCWRMRTLRQVVGV